LKRASKKFSPCCPDPSRKNFPHSSAGLIKKLRRA